MWGFGNFLTCEPVKTLRVSPVVSRGTWRWPKWGAYLDPFEDFPCGDPIWGIYLDIGMGSPYLIFQYFKASAIEFLNHLQWFTFLIIQLPLLTLGGECSSWCHILATPFYESCQNVTFKIAEVAYESLAKHQSAQNCLWLKSCIASFNFKLFKLKILASGQWLPK